jgi:hypothetical protein
MVNCESCSKEIGRSAAAALTIPGRGLVAFCSLYCRDQKRAALADSAGTRIGQAARHNAKKDVARSGNAKPGVVGRPKTRKLTPSEIKKRNRPSETAISNDARGFLDNIDVWNTRIQSGAVELKSGRYMKLSRPGTPDRMFADGLIAFLEIKKPGERPRPDQVEAIARLRDNGAIAFVVDDFGQCEFIVKQMAARYDRIIAIRDLIREIGQEIETEFNRQYGRE